LKSFGLNYVNFVVAIAKVDVNVERNVNAVMIINVMMIVIVGTKGIAIASVKSNYYELF
jgi:hypothetical protein